MAKNTTDKVEKTVDNIAGAGTSDKVEGKTQELLGTAQHKLGKVLEDPTLTARGVVNQADGQAKQDAGELKSELELLKERAKELLGDTAEIIKGKTHHTKDGGK